MQAILARTLLPCQDTPDSKSTYTAEVSSIGATGTIINIIFEKVHVFYG